MISCPKRSLAMLDPALARRQALMRQSTISTSWPWPILRPPRCATGRRCYSRRRGERRSPAATSAGRSGSRRRTGSTGATTQRCSWRSASARPRSGTSRRRWSWPRKSETRSPPGSFRPISRPLAQPSSRAASRHHRIAHPSESPGLVTRARPGLSRPGVADAGCPPGCPDGSGSGRAQAHLYSSITTRPKRASSSMRSSTRAVRSLRRTRMTSVVILSFPHGRSIARAVSTTHSSDGTASRRSP